MVIARGPSALGRICRLAAGAGRVSVASDSSLCLAHHQAGITTNKASSVAQSHGEALSSCVCCPRPDAAGAERDSDGVWCEEGFEMKDMAGLRAHLWDDATSLVGAA
jgi:hypothetical protein